MGCLNKSLQLILSKGALNRIKSALHKVSLTEGVKILENFDFNWILAMIFVMFLQQQSSLLSSQLLNGDVNLHTLIVNN